MAFRVLAVRGPRGDSPVGGLRQADLGLADACSRCGSRLAGTSQLTRDRQALSRWGHILLPVVRIGIGLLLILIEGGAFGVPGRQRGT